MANDKKWLAYISDDEMRAFLLKHLCVRSVGVETAFSDYGKFFTCISRDALTQITGNKDNGCVFGNYGLVKRDFSKNELLDDFSLAETNPEFFKNYVLFVAKKNMVNGHPVRHNGLTYQDEVIMEFAKYIQAKKVNPIAKLFNKGESKKQGLVDLLVELDKELDVVQYLGNQEEPETNM